MTLLRYEYPRRYADFMPGTVIAHEQRRVITEADNLLYSRLSGHEHPYFFAYAEKREGRARALLPQSESAAAPLAYDTR